MSRMGILERLEVKNMPTIYQCSKCVALFAGIMFVLPAVEELTSQLRPLFGERRIGAPLAVECTLRWTGTSLRPVRPEIHLRCAGERVASWQGPEWVVTPGRQARRWLLPLGEVPQRGEILAELVLRDADGDAVHRVEHLLHAGSAQQAVVALVGSAARVAALRQRCDMLLLPPAGRGSCGSTALLASDLPEQAEHWLGLDLVVFDAVGVEELSPGQRQSLQTWLRQGGTALVVAGAGDEVAALVARLAPAGAVSQATPPCVYCGLGRVLGIADGTDSEGQRATWHALWRQGFREAPLAALPVYSVHELLRERVSQPPWILVLLLIAGFVLLIGPGDRLLVRLLRRHLLTWVSFPLWSLAITVALVLISQHFLGGGDHRRSLTIHDLDQDGTMLRSVRIDRFFLGRGRELELADGLAQVVGQQPSDQQMFGLAEDQQPGFLAHPRYAIEAGGLVLRRDLPKWTPGLVRTELAAVSAEDEALIRWWGQNATGAPPAGEAADLELRRWSWMSARCQGWPGSAPRPAGLDDLAFLSHDDSRPVAMHLLRRGDDWVLLRRILPLSSKESP